MFHYLKFFKINNELSHTNTQTNKNFFALPSQAMSQQPPPPPPPPPPASSSSSTSEKEPLKVTIVEDESKEMNEMKEEAERLTAKDKVEIAMYADKLYGDAKELMAQGRFKEASDVLSHVLEKKSLIFGEESVECLEPYIDYGKSLLTMAKQISVMKSVFASDPQKAILNENEKEKEKKKEEEEEEGDDDDADDDDDDNSAEKAKTEGATSVSTGDDDDDEHEDINELLETAWDCLELARVVKKNNNNNNNHQKRRIITFMIFLLCYVCLTA